MFASSEGKAEKFRVNANRGFYTGVAISIWRSKWDIRSGVGAPGSGESFQPLRRSIWEA